MYPLLSLNVSVVEQNRALNVSISADLSSRIVPRRLLASHASFKADVNSDVTGTLSVY